MTETSPGTAVPAERWQAVVEASQAFMAAANRMNTLYELSLDYQRLLDLLSDPGSDEQAIEAELDQIAGLITHKAEAIAGLIAHLDGLADARRAEAQRLLDRAAADDKHAERLRAYVLRNMQALGSERIDTLRFTLAVRTNPPAVEILEPMLVPDEFWRTLPAPPPVVDRKAILANFKQTGEVPAGVEIVRRQRLEVR